MSAQPETLSPAGLRTLLAEVGTRDARQLGRRIDKARQPEQLARVAVDVERARERLAARAERVPRVRYPEQLPVSQRREDILAAIREHQVVVVAGETGSGKTTQIPKMCLELGRGVKGMIGHTQPRRIAARAVAERIAEEVGSPLGEDVGYAVRFHDQVGDATYVKVMTDGILLAEIQSDRLLTRYDTIIIDEAHERSLNIDFLLGYLKQLLPRRPDLKIVITSATIDPQRFADHFDGAPVIEVSGRTYPVEVRYRPLVTDADDDDTDQVTAICDAVDELAGEGPGDVLVFLSGEREIRDTAEALRARTPEDTEVLPLYARLSAAEQHRVFEPRQGRRRVVLATNVAETSLTVPGIRYVVDPGTARISRYSQRTKVQRLPIEAISQASAKQRSGRCGRVEAGICIRLYAEDDYEGRPEFTDPEIQRTNLASVILQMTSIGLGDIAAFPFVDPPDSRNIRDGVQLLGELGALDGDRLTPVGRQLAQLPLDPRLARMVVEADRNGVLHEVLVLAAALSIQDPRERPQDKQQAAAEKHARFADETSDFLSYWNLWTYVREQQRVLGSSAFRRLCKQEFLNHLRIREWQDVHGQLRQVTRTLGLSHETPHPDGVIDSDKVHQSLLAGLLSHVGLRDADKRDYLGARGARFNVVPGSALFKKTPRWVVVSELVETNRLWGRVAARVQPEWVEALAGHLVVRTYAEPHWDRAQAAVIAYERVTLYGLPLVTRRAVNYGRVDPETSRDILRGQPAAARRRRGARAPRSPARHRRRRPGPLRLLRRADPLGRRLRPALRRVVEEGPARDAGPAHHDDGDARQRAGLRRQPRRLPGRVGAGRPAAGPDLPVLARRARRRRHRARAAAGAQPALARGLRLAGAGPAPGPRRRRHQGAAQAAAGPAGAGAGHGARRAGPARAAVGPVPRGADARAAPAARRRRAARGRRPDPGPGPPQGDVPGVLRHPDAR
jgi:ATP-dependent helicase HrpA